VNSWGGLKWNLGPGGYLRWIKPVAAGVLEENSGLPHLAKIVFLSNVWSLAGFMFVESALGCGYCAWLTM
jgi:hypothetical protein